MKQMQKDKKIQKVRQVLFWWHGIEKNLIDMNGGDNDELMMKQMQIKKSQIKMIGEVALIIQNRQRPYRYKGLK